MSVSVTITRSIQLPGGVIQSGGVQKTAGQLIQIDENIPQSQTDALIALALDVSQIKALFMMCDTAITLETNSSSAPDNTIALVANVPITWAQGDANACPLTVDVTALYATNGAVGSGGSQLKIIALVDPTV